MQCLILAGGKGTRMLPHSRTVPKALLPVAGRPFAEWQLEWLATEGIDSVIYSIGHLGEAIEAHLGDGAAWGVNIAYVREHGQLLGTAGAVRLSIDTGLVDETFFVLYGDSYLSVQMSTVEQAFRDSRCPALMTVYRNRDAWDNSNAVFRDGMVPLYDKANPLSEGMEYIDYGLLAMSRSLIEESVPSGQPADLAPLLGALSRCGALAGMEVSKRFFEVGSPRGRQELEEHLSSRAASRGRRGLPRK